MKNYYNEEILKLISDNILNKSVDELKEFYIKFDKQQYPDKIKPNETNSAFRKYLTSENVSKNRQFDLPYHLPHTGENKLKGTLILLGMDAKGQDGDNILLSSPYDIHGPKPKALYSEYIDVLRQDFNIYLTDIYKTYWENKDGTISTDDTEYKKKPMHMDILLKEVEIIGRADNFIGFLAWGDDARKGILSMFDQQPRKTTKNPKGQITREELSPYLLSRELKLIASTHPGPRNAHKDRYFDNNNLGKKWDSKIIAEAVIKAFE